MGDVQHDGILNYTYIECVDCS